VISRADDLDGNSYPTLTTASDAMEAEHPLAATLMRRAMIRDTLVEELKQKHGPKYGFWQLVDG
jgi:hypothetical protein